MLRAVYFPNVMRLFQGMLTLGMITILIVKNNDFVDLLMNFTALYVISEVDDVMFKLIRKGFFPCFKLMQSAALMEEIEFKDVKKRGTCICRALPLMFFEVFV